MSALLDKIPFVPKLTKFLVCLDLYQSVKYTSIGLGVLWIIYAIVGFVKLAIGGAIWGLIWCIVNVLAYAAVVYGMQKSNRLYTLPALYISIFNVIVGIINAIINFVSLALFSAIWILFMQLIIAYYFCALKSVHDDMGSSGQNAPSQETKSPV